MSRIAKYPVVVPEKVEITIGAAELTVKGPLGTLKQAIPARVVVKKDGDKITFAAADETKQADALSGTARALVANTDLDARAIAQKAMAIASEICIYTNSNIAVEEL